MFPSKVKSPFLGWDYGVAAPGARGGEAGLKLELLYGGEALAAPLQHKGGLRVAGGRGLEGGRGGMTW